MRKNEAGQNYPPRRPDLAGAGGIGPKRTESGREAHPDDCQHNLWIRLLARRATYLQAHDFMRYFHKAQKCGTRRAVDKAASTRSSAHILWIRLCASPMSTPEVLDFNRKIAHAQICGIEA
jgi:hypothetical protein